MSSLEKQLATNRLPLPQNFNGYQFSTPTSYFRKQMPSYLEKDLPPLKYHFIRQEFKAINKVECPRLTYFKTKINEKFNKKQKKSSQPQLSKTQKQIVHTERQLSTIRQQLKYTLMTADRSSNVITSLINRANSLEEQKKLRQTLYKGSLDKRKKKNRRKKEEEGCFSNTIDLVFLARKQAMRARLPPEPNENPESQSEKDGSSVFRMTFSTIQK